MGTLHSKNGVSLRYSTYVCVVRSASLQFYAMCGITGTVGKEMSIEMIDRVTAEMDHRGPDDRHCYVGDGVAFGACRLSIIDLDGGRQPLCNEDGTVWITYNGEVFNAPVLREALIAAGHVFRTDTDTEVVVHGYEEWGDQIVGKLRGMFAFAIWDVRRERLLLARDHFGMKPLYYAEHGECAKVSADS